MNELEALRSVAQILARVATPIERQNIARRVAQKTKGDDSEIALSLPHAAALFWPGDAEKTAEVLRQITLAFDAGELGGFLPREHRHILFTELTVWPDCPPMAADSPLRHWVPDAPAKPQAAPVVADSASNAPDWTVSKPQRYNGYTAPLHRLLAAAHRDGNPCPTARDVVEAWRNNAPAEIAKVLPDGFDYYDAKGNTKTADLEAIRKAIGRMTIAR